MTQTAGIDPSADTEKPSRLAEFLARFPEYAETSVLDDLRRVEYARLDEAGHVYLDYTGGGVWARSQVEAHFDLLRNEVLGNPHSSNPSSAASTALVESCRRRVLEFFRADPTEYELIFTSNASHSLKLVGESYPFVRDDVFLLTFDNHNSVNGIREFDRACGAETRYVPSRPPRLRISPEAVLEHLDRPTQARHKLFAFPAQSNFSGVQHPLEWVEWAQDRGWDVLLDAAAFVPTNRLDLSRWHPDYVALSFYKMFGYPTGVGALLARRPALAKLHRPWFAGGTITVASVQADTHVLAGGFEAFEDGTVNYTCLPAVEIGLDYLDSVGMELIHERVRCLTGWIVERLTALKHANGRPLVRLYGPKGMKGRGGTVTMNFQRADGTTIDHQVIEDRAAAKRISLRTGCFCNPGAGELALGITKSDLDGCFADPEARASYDDFRRCIDISGTGAVRVSVGLATNFADVEAFLRFAAELRE